MILEINALNNEFFSILLLYKFTFLKVLQFDHTTYTNIEHDFLNKNNLKYTILKTQ